MRGKTAVDPAVRFLRSYVINPHNGCWDWTGSRDKLGYGRLWFSVKGKNRGQKPAVFAHRLSYELFNGSVDGLCVCHKCDRPCCVNPQHLFAGTNADNLRDAMQKDRLVCKPRLAEKDVIEIRRSEMGIAALARKYGVSPGAIADVKRGRTWKHVP